MAQRVKREKSHLRHIPDWQAADTILRQIGDLQMQITAAQTSAKDDINDIKQELADTIKPLNEEVKLLTESLELFANSHAGDFGKKRSRNLNFGTLGWRKSFSISIKKTTIELIKQVFSGAKAKAYLRIKEDVDKDALKKLTDEQLAEVGARRKEKDVFFVEPAQPDAVDYTE